VALALSGGKEELARFSIRRMLPKRRTVVELRERIELASEERDRLQSHLDSQEAEFELLEQRVRTLLATQRAGESLPEPAHVADEEVELELLRRRAGAEATR
jgi:phage shock protein A